MYRQFFRPKTFWLNHLKKEISAKGPPADGARSIAPQFPGKFERSDARAPQFAVFAEVSNGVVARWNYRAVNLGAPAPVPPKPRRKRIPRVTTYVTAKPPSS